MTADPIEHIELRQAYEATPAALADVAAEAIRALNHATFGGRGRLAYPSSVYETVGSLQRAVGMLDQALDQLARFLEHEHQAGRVEADDLGQYAGRTAMAVFEFREFVDDARKQLAGAHQILGYAHTAAAGLAAAGDALTEPEPGR